MRAKKSSSADLNKKSSFYLAIGLFLVLLVSWRAIEWKNYDDDGYGYIALDVDDDDDEEIPITEQLKTPPPPPPPFDARDAACISTPLVDTISSNAP